MPIERLWRRIVEALAHEDGVHMRRVANRYSERSFMDGEVIKKTGEVIPKESV